MDRAQAILIAGPTASGKSGLALALAERLGGVVINADSMQVYRDLRILTARPSPEDEARAPHALYGFVPGRDSYSAGRYMADATQAITEARAAGRVPIVVGGTGLYLKALLEGLSPIPAVPQAIREHWRAEARRLGAAALHHVLNRRDPETAARLQPTDPQRLARALEVLEATGRPLAHWQRERGQPGLDPEAAIRLVVAPPRDELHRRIEARFEAMMAAGVLEEVEALVARGYARDLPIMRAHGVRPLMRYLAGESEREAAVSQAMAETRQYAKRQMTWLIRNMIAWKWPNKKEMESIRRGNYSLIED